MQNTIDFYQNEFTKRHQKFFGDLALRQQALDDFVKLGWPTTKQEAWKYTRPKFLQEQTFALDVSAAFHFSDERYVNVAWIEAGESRSKIQENKLTPQFSLTLNPGHNALSYLNDALWTESAIIHIPKDVRLEEKLRIQLKSPAVQHARFLKLFIQLDENAAADIVLENLDARESFINLLIETNLHKKARLNFSHICQNQAMHYVMHNVYQATQSAFNTCELNLCASWFRQDLNVHLQGEYAECELKGLYLAKQKEHVDQHLCVTHEVPHCKSKQFFKGILTDQAKAVFNGKVDVARNAQKTDATQKNNNMLLSAAAEVYTKPELEIYADDVICAHGATVGELSEEAMFYLESRGIHQSVAKKMLLSAFAEEVVPEAAKAIVERELESF